MRTGISISLSDGDRRHLEAIVTDRNASKKQVWRARIVLLIADGVGTNGIMTANRKSKLTFRRRQECFMESGVNGLLWDNTRSPGKVPAPSARGAEVVRLTREAPPHEATHCTARAMAKAVRLAVSTRQAIWKAQGLAFARGAARISRPDQEGGPLPTLSLE